MVVPARSPAAARRSASHPAATRIPTALRAGTPTTRDLLPGLENLPTDKFILESFRKFIKKSSVKESYWETFYPPWRNPYRNHRDPWILQDFQWIPVYFLSNPGAEKGPQKGSEMERKGGPKGAQNQAFLGSRKASNPFCFPCVFAQNGPPKGAHFEPEMEAKIGPKMEPTVVGIWVELRK